MEQDFKIGIIGGGPAGCCCAYFLREYANVSIIDNHPLMSTILPTGGGRCNLAHAEFDFRELAKNYPRGEKFLYSIFSKFGTGDTIDLFQQLGIETYTQVNGRIFPTSNSSKEVQENFVKNIKAKHIKEKALRIEILENGFKVVTDMNSYKFDKLICATGGHSGYDMIKRIGISVINPKPSLVGLVTTEKFSDLMGVVSENAYSNDFDLSGNILFTHFGVSGPLIYQISSLKARDNMPYNLSFDLCPDLENLQDVLNNNSHKFIKNVLGEYLPMSLAEWILKKCDITSDTPAHKINGKQRDSILNKIHNFEITVKSTQKDGETVSAGGVDLDKINPKTMESKEVAGLYFCGEVINVDGFCGGFNLQNCWSTAYIAASAIKN